MKRCSKCGVEKPAEDFYKNKSAHDGYQTWCKVCSRALQLKSKHKLNEYSKNYRLANHARRIVHYAKSRAKKMGLLFDLVPADIPLPTNCPVLGLLLDYTSREGKKNRDDAPSLDRIDPKKGYVRGNVQVISLRANRIKNDATVAELRTIADFMEVMHG